MKRWIFLIPALLVCAAALTQSAAERLPLAPWAAQETAAYKVVFSTALKTDLSLLGTEARDTNLMSSISGTMQLTCTDTGEGKWYFYGTFPVIDSISFPLPQQEQQHIKESLHKGFYFSQRHNGIIDSIWFPHNVSAAAEHITFQLLEYFQYHLPAIKDTNLNGVLPVTEGLLSATYRGETINKEGARNLVGTTESISARNSKPAHDYLSHLIALTPIQEYYQVGMIARTNQYTASVGYLFSSHTGKLQQVAGTVIRKGKINHTTITTLTNTFQYNWLPGDNKPNSTLPGSTEPLAASPGVDQSGYRLAHARSLASMYGRPLYYPEKQVQRTMENYRIKSRSISIAGILRGLQQNEIRKEENRQDKLTDEIRTSFLTNKDSLYLLRKAFMEADVNGITFKTLRTGIITSSTTYAQEIVRDYIHVHKPLNKSSAGKPSTSSPDKLSTSSPDKLSTSSPGRPITGNPARLKKILPSAGLMRSPLPLLQAELEILAFDTAIEEGIRSSALLALGNIAGILRHTDSLRADTMAHQLATFLHHKGDDMLLLSVLGNCGVRSCLPYILPLLSDSAIAIKAYAYYALRFVAYKTVDSLYAAAMTMEQEPEVLTNVFNALFLRHYSDELCSRLYTLIEQYTGDKIRMEALQVLLEWSYRRPALLTVIKKIAVHNSNTAVRQNALQFLAGSGVN